jgi:TRAP-type C4-dicarboxylate transport system permease small subunit
MEAIKRLVEKLNRYCAELCGWLLLIIMILLIIDFVGRGLSRPIQGVGELAVFVMVAIVYLGLGHTEHLHGHVRVDALKTRLSIRAQHILNAVIHVIATITVMITCWAVYLNAVKAFQSKEAIAGTVPLLIWPVKWVVVVGCVLYLLQLLINTIQEIRNSFQEAEL